MLEVVFVVLLLLVLAWAFHTFIPHPFGLVLAVLCGLLALYVLVAGVVPELETR